LGRYELLFPAGKGGMGQVWAAKLRGSQGFRKIVALKTLLASEAFSEEMQRMLRDEAMLASHIKNPHVAETLDFDLHEGIPYLVMEWVDGESLADLLHEFNGPMSLRHVVAIANQLCKGLDAAHKATDAAGAPLGLVHRDVSPPNILISFSGTVKLADFGIAQVAGAQEVDADKGLKGKFSYMAPEQIQGGALDARTDVFALAVLLYRLVTAKYPFAGADVGETLWQISSSITPRSPRALNESLPPRVAEVILKGLEKDPAQRFESAEEMRAALERAVPPNLRGNSETAIAELMAETLGERMEQRRKKTARALLSAPPAATDQATTQSLSTLKGLTYNARPNTDSTQGLPPPARRISRRNIALVAGGALLVGLGFLIAGASGSDREARRSSEAKPPVLAGATRPGPGLLPPALARPEAQPPTPPPPTELTMPSPERTGDRTRAAEPSHESRAPRSGLARAKQSKPTKQREGAGHALHSAGDLKAPY
jgi:serine/threonine-protein kinase